MDPRKINETNTEKFGRKTKELKEGLVKNVKAGAETVAGKVKSGAETVAGKVKSAAKTVVKGVKKAPKKIIKAPKKAAKVAGKAFGGAKTMLFGKEEWIDFQHPKHGLVERKGRRGGLVGNKDSFLSKAANGVIHTVLHPIEAVTKLGAGCKALLSKIMPKGKGQGRGRE